MIKICFICSGNTCRSIMAERLMKKKLKDMSITDIKVSSKGLSARGENINENAKQVLKKLGVSSANRKSVKLKKLDKNTLYITMTESQREVIKGDNVLSFKSLLGYEIVDPYGQDEEVYKKTALNLVKGIDVLIEKIKTWRKI